MTGGAHLWRRYAATGAAAAAGYFALPGLGLPAVVPVAWYFAISLSAAAAVVIGVRRHRPRRPAPWYLLAAGQTLYAVADLVFYLTRSVYGIDRYPYYDDVLYLAAYPLLAGSLIAFVRSRTPDWDLPGIIDSLIVSIAAALLMWVYLVGPTVLGSGEPALARTVSVAYPAMDLLLITLAIRLTMGRGARSPAFHLIIGAIGVMLVADVGYGYLELNDAYVPGGVLELLWLVVALGLGSAGLHPSMATLTSPAKVAGPQLSASRFALLFAASTTAPVLLLVHHLRGQDQHITAFAVACLLLFALTLARVGTFAHAHRELANSDVLTGARTRRYFDEALARSRRNANFGLLLLDIDHFKHVNDTYGHEAGDRVLTAIGAVLRSRAGDGDVIARYGGEEFAVLVAGVPAPALVAYAERIRAAVAGEPIMVAAGQAIHVTVSVGGAWCAEAAESSADLLGIADSRLYAAKRAGRNRVVCGDAITPIRAGEPRQARAPRLTVPPQ